MNTELRKQAKNDFEKNFFKLMNNSVFGKTMENVTNYRDTKIVTTNKQRNKFASKPNYHSTKRISKDFLIMEMKKVEIIMNKPIYIQVKQYQILVKQLRMNFGTIILNQSTKIK